MNLAKHILIAAVAGALTATLAPQALAQSAPAAKPAAAKPAAQRAFDSREDAARALTDAVRALSREQLLAVVGPHSASWLFSGDPVADKNDWEKFVAAYDAKHGFEEKDGRSILVVGNDGWPFPAPIVKRGAKFAFDADAGREEIINRRVGRNELDTIQSLLAIVDAQREYAARDFDGNGYADYARRFRSTPGKKDGLYWPAEAGKPESPLGPIAATAAREGYGKMMKSEKPEPYHGYYFRILTSQGKEAPGGAYDYLVGDKLVGGFAVVAFPAAYGSSGIMTFLVNHEGVVYEKDLGKQTTAVAGSMTRFNPDATWRKTQ